MPDVRPPSNSYGNIGILSATKLGSTNAVLGWHDAMDTMILGSMDDYGAMLNSWVYTLTSSGGQYTYTSTTSGSFFTSVHLNWATSKLLIGRTSVENGTANDDYVQSVQVCTSNDGHVFAKVHHYDSGYLPFNEEYKLYKLIDSNGLVANGNVEEVFDFGFDYTPVRLATDFPPGTYPDFTVISSTVTGWSNYCVSQFDPSVILVMLEVTVNYSWTDAGNPPSFYSELSRIYHIPFLIKDSGASIHPVKEDGLEVYYSVYEFSTYAVAMWSATSDKFFIYSDTTIFAPPPPHFGTKQIEIDITSNTAVVSIIDEDFDMGFFGWFQTTIQQNVRRKPSDPSYIYAFGNNPTTLDSGELYCATDGNIITLLQSSPYSMPLYTMDVVFSNQTSEENRIYFVAIDHFEMVSFPPFGDINIGKGLYTYYTDDFGVTSKRVSETGAGTVQESLATLCLFGRSFMWGNTVVFQEYIASRIFLFDIDCGYNIYESEEEPYPPSLGSFNLIDTIPIDHDLAEDGVHTYTRSVVGNGLRTYMVRPFDSTGNESTNTAMQPLFFLNVPGAILLINDGDEWTDDKMVTLSLTDVSNVDMVSFSNDNVNWYEYTYSEDQTYSWDLSQDVVETFTVGDRTVLVKMWLGADTLFKVSTDDSILYDTPPVIQYFNIKSIDPSPEREDYTYDLNVHLYYSVVRGEEDNARLPLKMRLKNRGEDFGEWVDYVPNPLDWLLEGDAADWDYRYVDAEFKNYRDELAVSTPDDVRILYVGQPPQATFVINNDEEITETLNVTLNVTYDENTTHMRFRNTLDDSWNSFVVSDTKSWVLSEPSSFYGTRIVYGQFYKTVQGVDIYVEGEDEIDYIVDPPQCVEFYINEDDPDQLTTDTRYVQLHMNVINADKYSIIFPKTQVFNPDNMVSYPANPVYVLDIVLPDGYGEKTVMGYFENSNMLGYYAQCWDTIIYEPTRPSNGKVSVNNDEETTDSMYVTLNISCDNATHMSLKNKNEEWGPWQPFSETVLNWHISLEEDGTTATVYARFKNDADPEYILGNDDE